MVRSSRIGVMIATVRLYTRGINQDWVTRWRGAPGWQERVECRMGLLYRERVAG